jgi:outer membrane protein OmpA-like peptidoglycan-associated protein
MFQSRLLIGSALFLLLLSACKKEEAVPAPVAVPEISSQAMAETAVPEVARPVEAPAPVPAPAPAPAADLGFSVDSVALSTAALPPFPFFKIPDGLTGTVKDDKNTISFDRHFFLAGKEMVLVEGRLYYNTMSLISLDKSREYSPTEFHRNYENAVLALGGAKISETQFTRAIVDEAGGLRETNAHWRSAPPTSGYEHHTYLIRTPDNEYWVLVSTAAAKPSGHIVVLEKAVMTQSLGFLDASTMKQALDADGRVALYINFDIDASTLRPDSQAAIAEIKTLLDANAGLKVSIEGHTDNTGGAARNRELSGARANSVLAALVSLGIDPTRLSAKGFGPDQPLANNADEAGRAKNRRVELVKI